MKITIERLTEVALDWWNSREESLNQGIIVNAYMEYMNILEGEVEL